MGYYMRFAAVAAQSVELVEIGQGLHHADAQYEIEIDQIEPYRASLYYGSMLLGEIEINALGDDIFEEDVEELQELLDYSADPAKQHVVQILERANVIIAVSVMWQGKNQEATLDRLEPLWDWLFDHYEGILQADNDGFYDSDGLILEMNLKI